MLPLIFEEIAEGQDIPPLVREPSSQDLVKFAAVAEDFSRQHWDRAYMESLGFPDVIVHGWLTLTYMCQAVTAWLPPDHARILRYEARHKRPIFPGRIILGGRVARKTEENGARLLDLDLWAQDAEGQVMTSGAIRLQMLDP